MRYVLFGDVGMGISISDKTSRRRPSSKEQQKNIDTTTVPMLAINSLADVSARI